MPRDLTTNQSQSNNQENQKPQATSSSINNHPADDEDFVDIAGENEDVDMQDPEIAKQSIDSLDLHSFSSNDRERLEDEDSDDEEHDHMASHPLLSMLTGRLGQRRRGSTHKWDSLHPVSQVLSVANVDDCTELEATAFPEHERCSQEKVCHFHFVPRLPPLSSPLLRLFPGFVDGSRALTASLLTNADSLNIDLQDVPSSVWDFSHGLRR
jgi:hypothetical protein